MVCVNNKNNFVFIFRKFTSNNIILTFHKFVVTDKFNPHRHLSHWTRHRSHCFHIGTHAHTFHHSTWVNLNYTFGSICLINIKGCTIFILNVVTVFVELCFIVFNISFEVFKVIWRSLWNKSVNHLHKRFVYINGIFFNLYALHCFHTKTSHRSHNTTYIHCLFLNWHRVRKKHIFLNFVNITLNTIREC